MKVIAPDSCHVNLTERCNLNCLHCFGKYGSNIELSLSDWKKIIDQLAEAKVFYIFITGGEPTQHPDFLEIINYLSKKKVHFILTTNCVFSEKIRKEICNNAYLIGLKISLDGPDWETHCFLRRAKNGEIQKEIFDITMENIKAFKDKNIEITINTCIHKKLISKFNDMVSLMLELKPAIWNISPVNKVGRAILNEKEIYTEDYFTHEFWTNIITKAKNKGVKVRLLDMPSYEKKSFTYECGAGEFFCEIHADGTMSPCTLARIAFHNKFLNFENLKDKNLLDIWNSKEFDKFIKWKSEGCEGCKYKEKCDRCPPNSYLAFGDVKAPTEYCYHFRKELGVKYDKTK